MGEQQTPRGADTLDSAAAANGTPGSELEAALSNLDRATRAFAKRMRGLGVEPPPSAGPEPPPTADADERPEPLGHPVTGQETESAEAADDDLDRRMREAEREAREYLEAAKRRADSLVTAMIRAVEREAGEIRRDAEDGIRARWRQVEAEAGRYLEEAERVAEGMVAERRERISTLSDGICARAETLTAGMEDAEQIRRQFDSFVRGLSATADRIAAGEAHRRVTAAEAAGDRSGEARGAIAA